MDAISQLKTLDMNGTGRNVADVAARHVRGLISRGVLPGGTEIPSGKELSKAWGISYVNAQRALAECARQGYLERRRHAGTVVAEQAGRSRSVGRVHILVQETEEEAQETDYTRTAYFAPLLAGMQDVFAAGEVLAVSSMICGAEQESLFLEHLHDHPVDGVLLLRSKETALAEGLRKHRIPLLLMDPHVHTRPGLVIAPDWNGGARRMVDWLRTRHRQRPALVTREDSKWTTRNWHEALAAELDRQYNPGEWVPLHFGHRNPARAAEELAGLLRSQARPDALLLHEITPGIVEEACQLAGLAPESLPCLGYTHFRNSYRPGADLLQESRTYGQSVARIAHRLLYRADPFELKPACHPIPMDLIVNDA